jgi:hypothetical protein
MQMLNKFIPSAVAVLVVSVAYMAWGNSGKNSEARDAYLFNALEQGMPRSQVVTHLGKPTRVQACGNGLWWGKDHYIGKNDGSCVREERYERKSIVFGIGYSKDGEVVSKYEYVSN